MIKRTVTDFFCTEDAPIVETKAGKLHGYRANGIYQFKGVPYARAKRFCMPEPVAPWTGVKDALAYGPGSPEMTYSIQGKEEFDFLETPGRMWSVNEDCQNLNVWTKSLDMGAKRPVMVWLHGGGFSGGSSTHLYCYEGLEMADLYDVVVVTVNHRLNWFGFLDMSEYGYPHSGLAGMMDIVEALRWVRDNIASFGGDPGNVTIYGQSGGGGKVCTLMQMPAADGLYHRAIMQSGGAVRRDVEKDLPKKVAAMALERLGLNRDTAREMETMDADLIGKALIEVGLDLGRNAVTLWRPVQEPGVCAEHPTVAGFREETKDIPIIVGSVVSEFGTFTEYGDKSRLTDEARISCLRKAYGDKAEAARDAFVRAYPELDWVYAADVDNRVRPGVIEFLNLRAKMSSAPCYNYIFEFETSLKGGKLLGHNSDLHFMFHNAHRLEAFWKPGVTERQQDAMAGAWAQFAYAGDPNGAGLAKWEPYAPQSGACMKFCDNSHMVYAHDKALMEVVTQFEQREPFPKLTPRR